MKKFKLIVAIVLVVFISIFMSKDRLLKKDKEITVIAQHDSEQGVESNSQNKNHSNSISNILLVNKTNGISKNYTPENITKVNIPFVEEATEEEKQMAGEPAKAVEDLVKQANEEGVQFLGSSAYRSYDTQLDTYTRRVKSQGQKKADEYVAKPGYSEHQTGLCIDLTNPERWFVGSTKEAIWLAENAHKFGFIIRYPKDKEDITGTAYEPWHIRYVGKDDAEEIYSKGLTLEEYLQNK
ncbi:MULTISPECIES: M15 family metallopeptidase [unclassified Clostridioides]|uniref:M15 family metallopeptidase n=1 Tax=unclassified Clostridioides TaxID=2635829 RepID=UPI001D11B4BB|nr:M15 family metallopeptidase [Clostridioides sp. ES-S-0171-01]MCC0688471.1 M15 family metallopeptidase [Clostridioides sp. ES-S-0056-01]MCC0715979.1 M15 family metallopeptidase [Clostridioides sp. ES-S-0077-01]UDN54636.1 M15 family metallopeptidase [Clostridioides sp. ES-S-0054-01]